MRYLVKYTVTSYREVEVNAIDREEAEDKFASFDWLDNTDKEVSEGECELQDLEEVE